MSGRAGEPTKPDNAGIPFHPPVPVAAILVVAVLLGWLLPTGWEGEAALARTAAALALGLFAAVVGVSALRVMARAKTGIVVHHPATAVVARGPYRFTRNPMYIALMALYLAIGLMLSWVWALVLFPAVFLLLDRVVVAREERYLEAKFGEIYRDFRARVPRWIGMTR